MGSISLKISLLVLALWACLSSAVNGQEPPVPEEGSRVRIRTDDGRRLVGTLHLLPEDTVWLRTTHGDFKIPLASVETLELSRGTTRPVAQGSLVGAFIGSGIGAMVMLTCEDKPGDSSFWLFRVSRG
jgi:hypothetical protein